MGGCEFDQKQHLSFILQSCNMSEPFDWDMFSDRKLKKSAWCMQLNYSVTYSMEQSPS